MNLYFHYSFLCLPLKYNLHRESWLNRLHMQHRKDPPLMENKPRTVSLIYTLKFGVWMNERQIFHFRRLKWMVLQNIFDWLNWSHWKRMGTEAQLKKNPKLSRSIAFSFVCGMDGFHSLSLTRLSLRTWFSDAETGVDSPDGLATMPQWSISTVLLPVTNDLMLLDAIS